MNAFSLMRHAYTLLPPLPQSKQARTREAFDAAVDDRDEVAARELAPQLEVPRASTRAQSVARAFGLTRPREVFPLHQAVEAGFVSVVQELIDHGHNANMPSPRGQSTPLHIAVARERPNTLEALLQHGAIDRESRDRAGRTPLAVALAKNPVNLTVVQMLLEAGARVDLNQLNSAIETANVELLTLLVRARTLDVTAEESPALVLALLSAWMPELAEELISRYPSVVSRAQWRREFSTRAMQTQNAAAQLVLKIEDGAPLANPQKLRDIIELYPALGANHRASEKALTAICEIARALGCIAIDGTFLVDFFLQQRVYDNPLHLHQATLDFLQPTYDHLLKDFITHQTSTKAPRLHIEELLTPRFFSVLELPPFTDAYAYPDFGSAWRCVEREWAAFALQTYFLSRSTSIGLWIDKLRTIADLKGNEGEKRDFALRLANIGRCLLQLGAPRSNLSREAVVKLQSTVVNRIWATAKECEDYSQRAIGSIELEYLLAKTPKVAHGDLLLALCIRRFIHNRLVEEGVKFYLEEGGQTAKPYHEQAEVGLFLKGDVAGAMGCRFGPQAVHYFAYVGPGLKKPLSQIILEVFQSLADPDRLCGVIGADARWQNYICLKPKHRDLILEPDQIEAACTRLAHEALLAKNLISQPPGLLQNLADGAKGALSFGAKPVAL